LLAISEIVNRLDNSPILIVPQILSYYVCSGIVGTVFYMTYSRIYAEQ